jgi:Ca-activated chloride channel family protein
MSDELDKLRSAMEAATPPPDATQKAANLALAEKNFDQLQGSRVEPRPSYERPVWAHVTNGARKMFDVLTSKGGLAATTALVAVGMFFVVGQRDGPLGPVGPLTVSETETRALAPKTQGARDQLGQAANRTREESQLSDFAAAVESDLSEGQALTRTAPSATQSEVLVDRLTVPVPADPIILPEADTEAFANEAPNPLKVTLNDPVSTFSIDVDTAAYAVVRSSLTAGQLPPQDAVRVEEMVNYFPYAYPAPDGTHPFRPTVSVLDTPWNADTQLVHIGIQGTLPELDARPPLNLVFLIDTSGSMQSPNKLPLLKQSFRLMLSELRAEDQVAIVAYAGSAGEVLEPTPAAERETILAALDRLEAGGSTAGQAGLQQAYATAEAMADDGELGRVILATDGDFNVGLSDPSALKDFISEKRETGTYLSVLGFGRGNLDDATMQALAQNGNGQAAYIDTLSEARKVLVDQLTGALFPIANDVKIQVEFNPATVAEYRLIGYETRALDREDFNNDRVDAGDIGAGHSVTAIYEITPVGSPGVLTDPLRYQEAERVADASDELGFLKLRYKTPGETESTLIETPILPGADAGLDDAGFAVAIAGFGQLLRGEDYLGDWSYADAIELANSTRGEDAFGYRTEAVNLMRLAEALSR